jgi:hypothetical protein
VTTILEARQLLCGTGGIDNVPSNENFVQNLSNRHYRNNLVDISIDVQAILLRAAVASGVSSPTSSMVNQTCIQALRMTANKAPPLLMPRTKKQLCQVRVALLEKNEALTSLICDTEPPNLQEALEHCMVQYELFGGVVGLLVGRLVGWWVGWLDDWLVDLHCFYSIALPY